MAGDIDYDDKYLVIIKKIFREKAAISAALPLETARPTSLVAHKAPNFSKIG